MPPSLSITRSTGFEVPNEILELNYKLQETMQYHLDTSANPAFLSPHARQAAMNSTNEKPSGKHSQVYEDLEEKVITKQIENLFAAFNPKKDSVDTRDKKLNQILITSAGYEEKSMTFTFAQFKEMTRIWNWYASWIPYLNKGCAVYAFHLMEKCRERSQVRMYCDALIERLQGELYRNGRVSPPLVRDFFDDLLDICTSSDAPDLVNQFVMQQHITFTQGRYTHGTLNEANYYQEEEEEEDQVVEEEVEQDDVEFESNSVSPTADKEFKTTPSPKSSNSRVNRPKKDSKEHLIVLPIVYPASTSKRGLDPRKDLIVGQYINCNQDPSLAPQPPQPNANSRPSYRWCIYNILQRHGSALPVRAIKDVLRQWCPNMIHKEQRPGGKTPDQIFYDNLRHNLTAGKEFGQKDTKHSGGDWSIKELPDYNEAMRLADEVKKKQNRGRSRSGSRSPAKASETSINTSQSTNASQVTTKEPSEPIESPPTDISESPTRLPPTHSGLEQLAVKESTPKLSREAAAQNLASFSTKEKAKRKASCDQSEAKRSKRPRK